MATQTDLFNKLQIKNYAIVDYDRFKKQTDVRMLALAAAAVTIWLQEAKSTFSASTAKRYVDALYWDPSNPTNIRLGILPSTFGDILEHGQNEHDLRSIFLKSAKVSKKGLPYRVIPMRSKDSMETASKEATPFLVSVGSIRATIAKRSPKMATFIIKSEMSRFNRANVASNNTSERGKFLPSGDTQFRTITGFRDINNPGNTWKHPGIRAALLGNKVSEWMNLNRESFTADMFQGDSGISE